MKIKLRKLVAIISVITLIMALIPVTAGAARVGSVIGYAKPTNIAAMINGYQMESYNVNGNTYVVVEDLVHYGFDVEWNGSSRSLYFNLNPAKTNINPQIEMYGFNNIGRTTATLKLLQTDINTYANGTWIPSYNINGKTIIQFDHLAQFGEIGYSNERREIYLIIDANINPLYTQSLLVGEEINKILDDSIKISSEVIVRAKGDILVCDIVFSNPAKSYVDGMKAGLVASDREAFTVFFRELSQYLSFTKAEVVMRYKDNSIIAVADIYI